MDDHRWHRSVRFLAAAAWAAGVACGPATPPAEVPVPPPPPATGPVETPVSGPPLVCTSGAPDGCREAGQRHLDLGALEQAEESFRLSCTVALDPAGCTGVGTVLAMRAQDDLAESWFRQGCEGGDANGCYRLAIQVEARGNAGEADRLYDEACADGVLASCMALGSLRLSGSSGDAEAAFRGACATEGPILAAACSTLGRILREAGRAEEAQAAFVRACDTGDAAGCRELGHGLDAGSGAGDAYRRGCEAGDAEACWESGRASLAGARFDEAEASFRSGCTGGHGPACLELGHREVARGAAEEAAVSYRKACDEDVAAGCRALASAVDATGGADASAELYGRACELGDAESCAVSGARRAAAGDGNVKQHFAGANGNRDDAPGLDAAHHVLRARIDGAGACLSAAQ